MHLDLSQYYELLIRRLDAPRLLLHFEQLIGPCFRRIPSFRLLEFLAFSFRDD